MKLIGKSSVSSVLKTILEVFYIFVFIWIGLSALAFLSSIINPESQLNLFNVSTIYKLDLLDETRKFSFYTTDQDADFQFELMGYFSMVQKDRLYLLFLFLSSMILWGLYLVIIIQLRSFFVTLEENKPFIFENAKRIRKIGVFIILSEIITYLVEFAAVIHMKNLIHSKNVVVSFLSWEIYKEEINIHVLFAGIVIIVISELFRLGAKMHEEHSLTI